MYPVNLDIRNRLCVVVGGGAVAERKTTGLLTAGAQVRIISPELTATLRQYALEGRISWLSQPFAPEDVADAFLVFAATSSPEVQAEVCTAAHRAGCLVNMVDAPELCDFHVPAILRRGDLVLAVSTAGTSPALAAWLKARLEQDIGGEYAVLARLLAEIRVNVLGLPLSGREKKMLFQKMLDSDILAWIRDGKKELLAAHVQEVFGHLIPVGRVLDLLWTERNP
ncbi:MAG: bifunctional precorrin-2 dehydrogenase/sirohydrochlorin ferrochelatase [Desulfobulbaceae bacterium]|nr:bifunctional precorrin-2 dehydrogenase/sirohydrochlorin ferrochelatase [Desulfobulbaceae bacterium]